MLGIVKGTSIEELILGVLTIILGMTVLFLGATKAYRFLSADQTPVKKVILIIVGGVSTGFLIFIPTQSVAIGILVGVVVAIFSGFMLFYQAPEG